VEAEDAREGGGGWGGGGGGDLDGHLGWEPWGGRDCEVGLNVLETLVLWMFSFGRASSASKIGSLYRFVYRMRDFFLMCT